MKKGLVCLVVAVGLSAQACSDEQKSKEDAIVIGSIFHDDIASSARLRLLGVKLAIDEMNASGVFPKPLTVVNRSPSKGDTADSAKAAENAKLLFDEDRAVGVISLFSGIGQAIIGVTNSAGYEDLVQCNCSATARSLNDPDAAIGDKNDTFYRTVVQDDFQGGLMVKLVQEHAWKKVGVYYIDDSFGQGLRDVIVAKIAPLGTDGYSVSFNDSHPTDAFDVTANQAKLNSIITKAGAGELDVLILPTLKGQSPSIIKYLTANGYKGAILLSDGAKTADVFTIATGITSWLAADVKNALLGAEPDAYAGLNSSVFTGDFVARFGEQPDTYTATAYDCAYAMGLSLLYASADAQTAASVKAQLPHFQQPNRTGTGVRIDRGAAGLTQATAAIGAGSQLDFEGASGLLLFDANGDRPSQSMRTYGPNAGCTAWETKDHYDPDLNRVN